MTICNRGPQRSGIDIKTWGAFKRGALVAGLSSALFGAAQAQEAETAPRDQAMAAQSGLLPAAEPGMGNAEPDAAAANTTGTGLLPASVTAGLIDSNGKVPVLNGVPGSAVPTLGIADPTTVLTHGNSYCVTLTFEDVNITGAYELDYYIKRTKDGKTTTLQEATIPSSGSTAPGDYWIWSIYTKAIPDSPGIATLVGRVRWGTGFTTQAVVTSTILIK